MTARFFGEPKMVNLWHHCQNTPFETIIFKSVWPISRSSGNNNLNFSMFLNQSYHINFWRFEIWWVSEPYRLLVWYFFGAFFFLWEETTKKWTIPLKFNNLLVSSMKKDIQSCSPIERICSLGLLMLIKMGSQIKSIGMHREQFWPLANVWSLHC